MIRRVGSAALLLVLAASCSGDSRPTGEAGQAQVAPAAPPQAPAAVPSPAPPSVPLTPPAPTKPALDPQVAALGHRYTEMFYQGELDLLYQKFSDEMRGVLPLDKLSALYENAAKTYGKQSVVIAEDSKANESYRGFVRWARFDKTDEVIEIQWILRPDDTIAGFFIRPAPKKVQSQGTLSLR